jgi:antitoxin PrlF
VSRILCRGVIFGAAKTCDESKECTIVRTLGEVRKVVSSRRRATARRSAEVKTSNEPALMVKAKVTSKGQITVPKVVRERLGLRPGDALEFHLQGDSLEVKPIRRKSILEFRGIFKVDDPPQIPWKEQRRLAWEWRAQHVLGQKNDQPDD